MTLFTDNFFLTDDPDGFRVCRETRTSNTATMSVIYCEAGYLDVYFHGKMLRINAGEMFVRVPDFNFKLGPYELSPDLKFKQVTISTSIFETIMHDHMRVEPHWWAKLEYIKKNNYFWNSGIFIWNVNTIVNAFRIYQPSMAKIFESMLPVYGTEKEQEEINLRFPECENISVDYAIMEKAEEIFVCPSDLGWSDLGTWGSLHEQSKKDLYGNVRIGQNIDLVESHNCIIHTTQEKRVVIQGLDGYIVAEKNNTLLICKLSEEQRIKQFSGSN
jgi:hypothetical protein